MMCSYIQKRRFPARALNMQKPMMLPITTIIDMATEMKSEILNTSSDHVELTNLI